MARLLFSLKTPDGVKRQSSCEFLDAGNRRGIRSYARAMTEQAEIDGAVVDECKLYVVEADIGGEETCVALYDCYRLINLPI